MNVAVLSGKGGTGKTLVSTNLAAVASESLYLDCDVEEPNGHLFFKPEGLTQTAVTVKMPFVDEAKCTGCRKCVEFCNYNALAYVGGKVKVFDEICHSCGGCTLICPEGAMQEKDKAIGRIESGMSKNVEVHSGIMNTGETSGVPIINALLKIGQKASKDIYVDCPPGSACVVMESIKDADYCVLVAEPTIFGVHNLQMVYDLVRLFHKPHGVVLNKCLDAFNPAEAFCMENGVPIIGKIPFDQTMGRLNGQGCLIVREEDRFIELFSQIAETITKEVKHETIVNP